MEHGTRLAEHHALRLDVGDQSTARLAGVQAALLEAQRDACAAGERAAAAEAAARAADERAQRCDAATAAARAAAEKRATAVAREASRLVEAARITEAALATERAARAAEAEESRVVAAERDELERERNALRAERQLISQRYTALGSKVEALVAMEAVRGASQREAALRARVEELEAALQEACAARRDDAAEFRRQEALLGQRWSDQLEEAEAAAGTRVAAAAREAITALGRDASLERELAVARTSLAGLERELAARTEELSRAIADAGAWRAEGERRQAAVDTQAAALSETGARERPPGRAGAPTFLRARRLRLGLAGDLETSGVGRGLHRLACTPAPPEPHLWRRLSHLSGAA